MKRSGSKTKSSKMQKELGIRILIENDKNLQNYKIKMYPIPLV